MKHIILEPEQNDLSSFEIIVRDKTYKAINELQYSGGFKRYGISLVDEGRHLKVAKEPQYLEMSYWLGKVFIKAKEAQTNV